MKYFGGVGRKMEVLENSSKVSGYGSVLKSSSEIQYFLGVGEKSSEIKCSSKVV